MPEVLDFSKSFLVRHKHLVLHLEPDEEHGGYVVTSPFVPGLVTQGDTFEEAIAMALDADEALREARAELQRRRQPTA
jgi:antitoxin HicB